MSTDMPTDLPEAERVLADIVSAFRCEQGDISDGQTAELRLAIFGSDERPKGAEVDALVFGEEKDNGDVVIPEWAQKKYPVLFRTMEAWF